MYKSVPPLQEMFNLAGLDLPDFLKGKTPEQIEEMAASLKNKSLTEGDSGDTPDTEEPPTEETK